LRAELPLTFSLSPELKRFSYVVTLIDTTTSAIRLKPCPSYTKELSILTTGRGGVRPAGTLTKVTTYRLNCQASPVIKAQSSMRFTIEPPVPKIPPFSSGALLSWRLNVPDGTGPAASSSWCATRIPKLPNTRTTRSMSLEFDYPTDILEVFGLS